MHYSEQSGSLSQPFDMRLTGYEAHVKSFSYKVLKRYRPWK